MEIINNLEYMSISNDTYMNTNTSTNTTNNIITQMEIFSITDKLEEVSPRMYQILSEDFNAKMYEMIYTGPKVMKWKFDSEFFDG